MLREVLRLKDALFEKSETESSDIVKPAPVLKKRKLGIGTTEVSKQIDVKLTNAKITTSLTAETLPTTTGKSLEMDTLKSSKICRKS